MAEKSGHKFIERGAHKGKGIAVFTSGGDSQVSEGFFGVCGVVFPVMSVLGDECRRPCHRSYGNLSGVQGLFY